MTIPKALQIDNFENYSSTVKNARKVLNDLKKRIPKEIDCFRLRIDKTTYCFTSREKLIRKLHQFDATDYDYAEPGQLLPSKKIRL